MRTANDFQKRWAVVLDNDDGRRMESFIRSWLGRPRWLGHSQPKQYCAFSGQREMLEYTLARARNVVTPSRASTVINGDHRRFVEESRRLDGQGRGIELRRRCDTEQREFLALTRVMAREPEALIALISPDNLVHPTEEFRLLLNEAYHLAANMPGQIVLLAATPDKEEPQDSKVAGLGRHGDLWNTMIMVARVSALWDIGRRSQPAMITCFDSLPTRMGRARQAETVTLAYRTMWNE